MVVSAKCSGTQYLAYCWQTAQTRVFSTRRSIRMASSMPGSRPADAQAVLRPRIELQKPFFFGQTTRLASSSRANRNDIASTASSRTKKGIA